MNTWMESRARLKMTPTFVQVFLAYDTSGMSCWSMMYDNKYYT